MLTGTVTSFQVVAKAEQLATSEPLQSQRTGAYQKGINRRETMRRHLYQLLCLWHIANSKDVHNGGDLSRLIHLPLNEQGAVGARRKRK